MSDWKVRAEACIAQGTGTYSKRWDQYVEGAYPTHLAGTTGTKLIDTEGKQYIDTVCGLGANLNGYYNSYSLPTKHEVILAEMIKERVKCIDKLKFLKTGSEACQAAVRIARAYKGVEPHMDQAPALVLGTGYHGHHSLFISEEVPGSGCFYERYIKLDTIGEIIDKLEDGTTDVCAVIIEPVQLEHSVDIMKGLKKLRDLCTINKVALIFDEIITGGRFINFCVSNAYDIEPDLICMGKALGNGYPVGIVGGKQKYMDTPGYFISSTFSGEQLSILKTIDNMSTITDEMIAEMWTSGSKFKRDFNKLSKHIQLKGYPTRYVWEGEEIYVATFWQEMLKRGYLCGKAFFVNYKFLPHMANFLHDAEKVITEIETFGKGLEGLLPRPVFKRD